MENRTYLPVDGEIQTEENIGKYGESVAAYESVLAGEAWPDNFWAATNLNRRIKEILTYLLRDKLKINEYETAKGVLSAGFIEEYGLSKLVEKADRPPEMMEGEFTYLLWYVFPEKQPSQKELTIKVYDEVLNGQRKAFPRGYFVRGSDVEYKAQVCFRHLCEDILKLDREGICRTFCNSGGIKILQKYKLKIVLDIVYESLFHLLSAAYPDCATELESYFHDKRLRSVKGGK